MSWSQGGERDAHGDLPKSDFSNMVKSFVRSIINAVTSAIRI